MQCLRNICSARRISLNSRVAIWSARSFSRHDNAASGRNERNKHDNAGEGASAKTGRRSSIWSLGAASVALAGCVGLGYYQYTQRQALCQSSTISLAETKAGLPRKDLPTYRLTDIQAHKNKDTGIWVTYKDGVYDITDFMVGHPGGDKIMLAAGASIEPFWDLYAIHRNAEVYEILEDLRIGNLHPDDKVERASSDVNDPYRNDPRRHPALKVNSAKPFNAEVPSSLLVDNFITPNDLFFVRNHLPVPKVDEKKFRLQVGKLKLSLDDLKKKFKAHSVVATVQCAGNRRSELSQVKAVKGLSWSHTAISNAEWTGVRLSDLFEAAGVKTDDFEHCILEGLDTDVEGKPYEASIPMETASDPTKEVIVAYSMNGHELPVDHGFPLRVIVPGTVGARQVKWIGRISASNEESKSHWQRNDYKLFNPSIDWETADYDKAVAIQEYPTQSAICEPADGSTIEGSEVSLKGYAWSGGGRGILRVEVTADGGKTWHEADIHLEKQRRHRQWAWVLWELTIPIPEGADKMDVACRALDTSHNSQPESLGSVWNIRGLINNAWHRVQLKVDNEE